MKISITPRKLKGTIWVPPSKSQAHRLIIGAALADGVSHLSNLAESQDIRATLNCMQCLGASVSQDGSEITAVRLVRTGGPLPVLDCGESGSTIRFPNAGCPQQWPVAACSWAEVGCWSGLTGPTKRFSNSRASPFRDSPTASLFPVP